MSASVEYQTEPTFDYESDPTVAFTSYSKMMHDHTRQQMEAARRSSRRRSGADGPTNPTHMSKASSISSQSSQASY